jgi:hypothetical protein
MAWNKGWIAGADLRWCVVVMIVPCCGFIVVNGSEAFWVELVLAGNTLKKCFICNEQLQNNNENIKPPVAFCQQ